MSIKCPSKCCELFIGSKVISEPIEYINDTKYKPKSGILLFDTSNGKTRILLTQSYNLFWGIPKGSKEEHECHEETSIRETKEETGININDLGIKDLSKYESHVYIIHKNLYMVFTIKLNQKGPDCICDPDLLNNETSGCGWIYLDCLYEMFESKLIKLNYITRLILQKNTNRYWMIPSKSHKKQRLYEKPNSKFTNSLDINKNTISVNTKKMLFSKIVSNIKC
ncbi:hydrolase, NUDIX family [Dasineura jujubifolia toursvirus 2a]|nr:hydrolase, NUDIX family [Dasineura jujubifolia toursvirus 2a]